ncbi:excinuclease ABC subunit UvrC [bacterium]|nr:excinuclease ABC subunit UvrC [bacterium]
MTLADLKRLQPPDQPGVYLMRNANGKIIYVGKAISIKKRLASYFRAEAQLDAKTRVLVSKIAIIEWMVTGSEVDALVLENTLIKKYRPRYNIVMKDDKSYPYLKLTSHEEVPRLLSTRKPFVDDAKYFGPFAGGTLKKITQTISRHFRLCQINRTTHITIGEKRTCLYYQMEQCDGVCMGKIPRDQYMKTVEQVQEFLNGGKDVLSPQLEVQMHKAAAEQAFELAAAIRDELVIIKRIRHQPLVSSPRREDRDVFGLARSGSSAAIEVFFVREGNLEGRRHFYLNTAGTDATDEILDQVLIQYYSQPVTIPPVIYLPQACREEAVIRRWLLNRYGVKIQMRVPKSGEARRMVKLAENNAWLYLKHQVRENSEGLSENDRKVLSELAQKLELSGPPLVIEGYDISNIAGQDAVGSQVVFVNGHPEKTRYRRYRIKSVEGPNDFAMLQEVLFRRLKRMKEKQETPPDLIVVDGGAGQLSSVKMVLQDLGLQHLAVIGLAKKEEEIYLPSQKKTLRLPKSSKALKVLTNLRDEAHRFAVTYHRKLRGRRMKLSHLDHITGLGKVRRTQLLRQFGSVAALLEVSETELAAVAGIGRDLAGRIQQVLRKVV